MTPNVGFNAANDAAKQSTHRDAGALVEAGILGKEEIVDRSGQPLVRMRARGPRAARRADRPP